MVCVKKNNTISKCRLTGKNIYSTGETWTTPVRKFSGHSFSSEGITYGNNKFVVISMDGYTSYSTDGENWSTLTKIPNTSTSGWRCITYSEQQNKFVAISSDGSSSNFEIATSNDGINWQLDSSTNTATSTKQKMWMSICYSEYQSEYLALSQDGYVVNSLNGVDWSDVTNSSQISFNSGIYYRSIVTTKEHWIVSAYKSNVSQCTYYRGFNQSWQANEGFTASPILSLISVKNNIYAILHPTSSPYTYKFATLSDVSLKYIPIKSKDIYTSDTSPISTTSGGVTYGNGKFVFIDCYGTVSQSVKDSNCKYKIITLNPEFEISPDNISGNFGTRWNSTSSTTRRNTLICYCNMYYNTSYGYKYSPLFVKIQRLSSSTKNVSCISNDGINWSSEKELDYDFIPSHYIAPRWNNYSNILSSSIIIGTGSYGDFTSLTFNFTFNGNITDISSITTNTSYTGLPNFTSTRGSFTNKIICTSDKLITMSNRGSLAINYKKSLNVNSDWTITEGVLPYVTYEDWYNSFDYINNKYVAYGYKLAISEDGTTWEVLPNPPFIQISGSNPSYMVGLVHTGKQYVALAYQYVNNNIGKYTTFLSTSENLINWSDPIYAFGDYNHIIVGKPSMNHNGLVYGNGTLIVPVDCYDSSGNFVESRIHYNTVITKEFI